MGPTQRSQFSVLTERSTASGDENEDLIASHLNGFHTKEGLRPKRLVMFHNLTFDISVI